jgi:hypothetical protein
VQATCGGNDAMQHGIGRGLVRSNESAGVEKACWVDTGRQLDSRTHRMSGPNRFLISGYFSRICLRRIACGSSECDHEKSEAGAMAVANLGCD